MAVPDAEPDGLDPVELFDVVIGTADNLAAWEQHLRSWPSPASRVQVESDGTVQDLGRVDPDVHPRLAGPAQLRARLLLRQQFGDLDEAREVLRRLEVTLDLLDELEPGDT